MADLFQIQILKVEGKTCSAELTSVNHDQLDIPVIENVAFQIVMEAYQEFGPFNNHPWKDKMDKWLSYMFREKVIITDEEYERYYSGNSDLPSDCSGTGFDGNIKFLLRRANNYEFVRAANNEISNIELPETKLIDNLPSGILKFTAYEKELFEHLSPEMKWRSALYDRSAFIYRAKTF